MKPRAGSPLVVKILLAGLLLTTLRTGDIGWLCDVDGVTRSECCGPDDRQQAAVEAPGAVVEAPCCCRIQRTDAEKAAIETTREQRNVAFECSATGLLGTGVATLRFPDCPLSSCLPPRIQNGRALLLMKNSLLI